MILRNVRIIAPSSGSTDQEIQLEKCVNLLKLHDFNVTYPMNLFSTIPHPYYANTFEIRLQHLIDAINDPNIDIIWAIKGGSNAAEIVDSCLNLSKSIKPKLLIGYSDITTLHLLFNQYFGLKTLHASVLYNLLDKQSQHMSCIMRILSQEVYTVPLTPANERAQSWNGEGVIGGGNLCILETNIGTKLHPQFSGKYMFLEDVAEPPYKIARMLNHLERAGVFENVLGFLFGDFLYNDTLNSENAALQDFFSRHSDVPIFRVASGHGNTNYPLLFGGIVKISSHSLEYALGDLLIQ